MAMTAPVQFSFSLQDSEGVLAALTMYALADPSKTIGNLITDWGTVAGLIDPITGGSIVRGKVALIQTGTSPGGKPVVGSPIEQTALFTLSNATNTRSFGQDVPSFLTSKIAGGRPNLADSDVSAFVTALTTPATDYAFTSNQFLVLSALRKAELSFRKHRRTLARLSSET